MGVEIFRSAERERDARSQHTKRLYRGHLLPHSGASSSTGGSIRGGVSKQSAEVAGELIRCPFGADRDPAHSKESVDEVRILP